MSTTALELIAGVGMGLSGALLRDEWEKQGDWESEPEIERKRERERE